MKHGFLLIDKPLGPTSHDIVYQVRKALPERKVGHLGTLDPQASGLMVLAVGAKALKVVELFKDLPKEYIASIRFGAVSATYDAEGPIEELPAKPGWEPPSDVDLQSLIADHFSGDIEQVPPVHSAVHVGGERAYRQARQGRDVAMPTRAVRIIETEILDYTYPDLRLRVACSSGTYIRSLAHDLGQRLRCGAYLSGLQRTKVGEWSLDFAVPPEAATWGDVMPLKEVMQPFPSVELTADEARSIGFGQTIDRQVKPDVIAWFDDKPIAILIPAKDGSQGARPRKVL